VACTISSAYARNPTSIVTEKELIAASGKLFRACIGASTQSRGRVRTRFQEAGTWWFANAEDTDQVEYYIPMSERTI
jgi:hypothetical protein